MLFQSSPSSIFSKKMFLKLVMQKSICSLQKGTVLLAVNHSKILDQFWAYLQHSVFNILKPKQYVGLVEVASVVWSLDNYSVISFPVAV